MNYETLLLKLIDMVGFFYFRLSSGLFCTSRSK